VNVVPNLVIDPLKAGEGGFRLERLTALIGLPSGQILD
jgi:hypothetical protein